MKAPHFKNSPAFLMAVAAAVAAGPAWAGTSTNSTGTTLNNPNPAETITLSGSTAMRSFTTSPGITFLNPGTSIVLHNGTGGAATTYTAPSGGSTSFQLASKDFTQPDTTTGTTQNQSALRLEWHEQGSVEGILELADGQINSSIYADKSVYNATNANPIWINQNNFGGTSGTFNPVPTAGTPIVTAGGHQLGYTAVGSSTRGTQAINAVQMAISDVNAQQAFSISGGSGAFNLAPGQAGYGKGNAALRAVSGVLNGIGQAGANQQLQDQTVLNMTTSTIDPKTGANYTAGAWNTAGLGNLDNKQVAVTATEFVANPGTGLTKVNRTDAQWLQTTGRLQNGANFNMTTRDTGSGTRNVAALNTGIDPSWAVGVNDKGNGNAADGGTAQVSLGSGLTFSNKTAGGGQLRPTVQVNRMAVGTLSISDAIGVVKNNSSSKPLRGLDYSDSTDGSAAYVRPSASTITDGTYVIFQNETYVTVKAPSAAFAGDTVAQWSARTDAQTGIKGDNQGDVAAFRGNILTTVANFPSTSVANAADQLLAKSFILPEMMQKEKSIDGVNNQFANPSYNATLRNAFLTSTYASNFAVADPSTINTGSSAVYGGAGAAGTFAPSQGQIAISSGNFLFGNFNQNGVRDYDAVVNSGLTAFKALYNAGSAGDAAHGTSMFSGSANSTKVTTGIAALDTMGGQDGTFVGGVANTTTGASKGDLIVLGDYAGHGTFDGSSLYALATGASLADANTTTFTAGSPKLTSASGATFGDQARNGVLYKNHALDAVQTGTNDAAFTGTGAATAATNASGYARLTARAVLTGALPTVAGAPAATDLGTNADGTHNYTFDPTGANAFNKFDVNHDGRESITDARIVLANVGKSYTNLNDQLSATITDPASLYTGGNTQVPFNLAMAKLTDAPTNSAADTTITQADVNLIARDASNIAGSGVLKGDANLSGTVDFTDLLNLAQHYNLADPNWIDGNFTGGSTIGFNDLLGLAQNYNLGSLTALQISALDAINPSFGAALAAFDTSAVPEPASLGVLALGGFALLRRRRNRA